MHAEDSLIECLLCMCECDSVGVSSANKWLKNKRNIFFLRFKIIFSNWKQENAEKKFGKMATLWLEFGRTLFC